MVLLLSTFAIKAQPTPASNQLPPSDSSFESTNPFSTVNPPAPAPVSVGDRSAVRFQQGNPFANAQKPTTPVQASTGPAMSLNAPASGANMNDFNLLSYALDARRRGDIANAQSALQQLIKRDPTNPQYQRLLRELPAFAQSSSPSTPSTGTSLQDLLGAPAVTTSPITVAPGGIPFEEGEGGSVPSVIPGEGTGTAPIIPTGVDPGMIDLDDFDLNLNDLGKAGLKGLKEKIRKSREDFKQAVRLRKDGEFAEANVLLESIRQELEATGGDDASRLLAEVKYELEHMLLYKSADDMEKGLFEISTKAIEDYEKKEGGPTKESMQLRKKLQKYQLDPHRLSIDKVSPDFIAEEADLHNLLIRARTQIVNGDRDGAMSTYREIELRYPDSVEAKYYQTLIANELHKISYLDRERTRSLLLSQISRAWTPPQVIDRSLDETDIVNSEDNPIVKKLKGIVIPKITLSNIELTRAIEFLSDASVRYDFTGEDPKGVNIIPVFDPNEEDPRVNLNSRNLTLERILEVLVNQVNFDFEVQEDAVVIAKSKTNKGDRNYIMEFFPVSRPTVLKLTGGAGGGDPGAGGAPDPFGGAPGAGAGLGGGGGEEEALKNFFIRAGIPLDDPDASFAFDGTQIIVRHSQRVIQRVRDILRRYDQQQTQVEIEAKFLEVQQGDLEELGFDWSFDWGQGRPLLESDGSLQRNEQGYPILEHRVGLTPNTRGLSDAFSYTSNSSKTTISRGSASDGTADVQEYDNSPPNLPNTLDLAINSGQFLKTMSNLAEGSSTIFGAAQVNLIIKALQRRAGTELLSAPKVTVNDQGTANITVAQEFRYPENYDPGEISQNGSGFTGATPNSFTERNVGVELSVTPQVQANDTISMHLEPTVTEFEGFVEYGGNSVVIGGGNQGNVGGNQGNQGNNFGGNQGFGGSQDQVVIVQPSGIYQPIFSVRRVVTDVTIYDGATVMIGGLTREEVKSVRDKVPILGNIPGIGRLFRSEGESSLKRNLVIFVTGNIISPGGGPARQNLATIERGSMFQNPIVITPAGPERRLESRQRRQN